MTAKQKESVAQFKSVCNTTEAIALDFLKRAKWGLDQAMDLYFASNPSAGYGFGSKKGNIKKVEDLYESLKG